MIRFFYRVGLLAGVLGLFPGAATTVRASYGKGDKATPPAATTEPNAAPTPVSAKPSAPFVVIRPRLPEPSEAAPASSGYLSPLDRLKQAARAEARGNVAVPAETTVTVQTSVMVKTVVPETAPLPLPAAKIEPTQKTFASKAGPTDKAPLVARTSVNSKTTITARLTTAILTPPPATAPSGRLARVTAYWACEGDYYTRHGLAATGVRLHDGHCAVDPNIIPYGSVVTIAGVGKFLAVDTGSAVISRAAAREAGHTSAERNAIVVDVFFDNRSDGEHFASSDAKWAPVSWWTPSSTGSQAKEARGLFAEEDWTKINGKQL